MLYKIKDGVYRIKSQPPDSATMNSIPDCELKPGQIKSQPPDSATMNSIPDCELKPGLTLLAGRNSWELAAYPWCFDEHDKQMWWWMTPSDGVRTLFIYLVNCHHWEVSNRFELKLPSLADVISALERWLANPTPPNSDGYRADEIDQAMVRYREYALRRLEWVRNHARAQFGDQPLTLDLARSLILGPGCFLPPRARQLVN